MILGSTCKPLQSRGKRGILAHPPAPPIFNVLIIFPHFFPSNQQKPNHPRDRMPYVCDQAQLFLPISTQKNQIILRMRSSTTFFPVFQIFKKVRFNSLFFPKNSKSAQN